MTTNATSVCKTSYGYTVLRYAMCYCDSTMVRLLLQHLEDVVSFVNIKYSEEQKVLHLAH